MPRQRKNVAPKPRRPRRANAARRVSPDPKPIRSNKWYRQTVAANISVTGTNWNTVDLADVVEAVRGELGLLSTQPIQLKLHKIESWLTSDEPGASLALGTLELPMPTNTVSTTGPVNQFLNVVEDVCGKNHYAALRLSYPSTFQQYAYTSASPTTDTLSFGAFALAVSTGTSVTTRIHVSWRPVPPTTTPAFAHVLQARVRDVPPVVTEKTVAVTVTPEVEAALIPVPTAQTDKARLLKNAPKSASSAKLQALAAEVGNGWKTVQKKGRTASGASSTISLGSSVVPRSKATSASVVEKKKATRTPVSNGAPVPAGKVANRRDRQTTRSKNWKEGRVQRTHSRTDTSGSSISPGDSVSQLSSESRLMERLAQMEKAIASLTELVSGQQNAWK